MSYPIAGLSLSERCGGSRIFLFMAMLDSILRKQKDINSSDIDEPSSKYDFIVVGAGSAGCVVASRLSEVDQFRVLLIEAGGAQPIGLQVPLFQSLYIGSAVDYMYPTQSNGKSYLSSPGQQEPWSRGKMLGGSSGLNSMMYGRGNRADFGRWTEHMGSLGWDYDSVLPYFRKTEHSTDYNLDPTYHGFDGPMYVERVPEKTLLSEDLLRAAAELGYPIVNDLNGFEQSGFWRYTSIERNGVRQSAAEAFLGSAWKRPNLDVLLNTRVTRIRTAVVDGKVRATGVETLDKRNRTRVIHARAEVIVSTGLIETPKLLLLSGIGGADELAKFGIEQVAELLGVGKHVLNHLTTGLFYNVTFPNRLYLNEDNVNQYIRSRSGPLSAIGCSVTAKVAGKDANDDDPNFQFFFTSELISPNNLCSKTGSTDIDHANFKLSAYLLSFRTKSVGYITLSSANPLDPPYIYPNEIAVEDDMDPLIELIEMSQRLMLETEAFGRRFNVSFLPDYSTPCIQLEYGSNEYWRCHIRHNSGYGHHQVGSCSMGPTSDQWVVDENLRVFGVDRLRVMDASVIPVIISGSTNAVAMMIGEKGADLVRQDWINVLGGI